MKKYIVCIAFFTGIIAASAQKINDPNAEIRAVENFHGISVGHAFDVYLSQGNECSVAVSAANEKDRAQITVEVKNGVLHIGLEKGWKWNKGNRKLKAYISFKELDKLNVSGACDVVIAGSITADKLSVQQSGASDLKGVLKVKNLEVDLSGASDMMVSGSAENITVEASGASKFKGYDLITENCTVTASGASDIKITVNKEMSAQASGASDVRYKGSGVIKELKSSGSSSVSKG